jgi:hypothetical protein
MKRMTFLTALLMIPLGLSVAQTPRRQTPANKLRAGDHIRSLLQHDWSMQQGPDGIFFASNHPAPPPFSTTGEPEATLAVESVKISGKPPSLTDVVNAEIKSIKSELQIAEYLEQDGRKPQNDVASWVEEIDGQQVAFIKYRAAGVKGGPRVLPRTTRHAILIKDGTLYFAHLTVIFARHQEEVRADQIRLIKGMCCDSKRRD